MHRLPSVVWTLAVTLFAATISHPAGIQKLVPVANQASQNHFGSKAFSETGLPCVPEVCLGDGMRRLSAVRWNKAKGGSLFDPTVSYATDLNVSEAQVKAIGRVFKGNTSAAVPYLIARTFDGDALAPLSAVTVGCAADKLYGQYTTTDGDPTTVGIALLPKGSEFQEWVVVEITREIPAALSLEEMNAVRQELRSRYARWESPRLSGDVLASFTMYTVNHLFFTLALRYVGDSPLHPACGQEQGSQPSDPLDQAHVVVTPYNRRGKHPPTASGSTAPPVLPRVSKGYPNEKHNYRHLCGASTHGS